jgi:hypothetical protein
MSRQLRFGQLTTTDTYNITGSLFGTASYANSASISAFAISSSYAIKNLETASINNATITLIKGNGTAFDITVNNVANSLSSSYATSSSIAATALSSISASYSLTASYALNAGGGTGVGFPYSGSAVITGSLLVTNGITGSFFGTASFATTASYVNNLGSSNYTQSFSNQSTWTFVHNLGTRFVIIQTYDSNYNEMIPQNIDLTNDDTATIIFPTLESGYAVATVGGAIQNASPISMSYSVNATSASYALTSSYLNSLTQNVDISGSLIITGSTQGNVIALSITSNTASLNLNQASFYTLQLVQGTNTFINPINIRPGVTSTLLISTTGSATVSFPSSIKQPSGSAYIPTTTTSKDILTFISYDASTLYVANVKNMI